MNNNNNNQKKKKAKEAGNSVNFVDCFRVTNITLESMAISPFTKTKKMYWGRGKRTKEASQVLFHMEKLMNSSTNPLLKGKVLLKMLVSEVMIDEKF